MSSNPINNCLVGLQNDSLDRDGLAMVGGLYMDHVHARQSQTADIFANSGMLAARSAITEGRIAPGPRRVKVPAMIWRCHRCCPNES